MALTDAQKAAVRRFCGFPQVGANHYTDASRDFSYGWTLPGVWETLASILDNLRPENEATIVQYLTWLSDLEARIYGSADNADTESAAVWKRNQNELAERQTQYRWFRLELCKILGVSPGPALQQQSRLVRG